MNKYLKILIILLLTFISLLVQLFIFNNMSLFGVKPNLILILVIIVSIYSNLYAGTVYSFLVGLLMDMLYGTQGIYTMSYTIIGMILGLVGDDYMKENYLSIVILTGISAIVFETIQYFKLMITTSTFVSILILLKQIILSILLNVVLVFLIYYITDRIIGYIDKKQNRKYW